MQLIDYLVIVAYFALVIGVGFWYQRRASRNLDSYFLGGKRIHWLALAMSGSVSNFDITGTMWIVTLICLFGMKSMWNHWMWGFLMGAFFMSFMGKWIRRSKVMTGAEWMVTRFGSGRDGMTARFAYTAMAVVTVAAFIGYAFQGIGKFTVMYVNVRGIAGTLAELFPGFSEPIWAIAAHGPETCAVVIFAITTLYVLLGGLYSVVITDVIQTIILTFAAILIAVLAFTTISPEMMADRLPTGFTSLVPTWKLSSSEMDAVAGTSYASYEFFGALVIVWVLKGLLLNAGGPAQMYDFQRFLAARNPRDAAKVGAAWSAFLVVRWAMAIGIALLALTGIHGLDDPERVMPWVLREYLPIGIRGLVIAGLLAAFMSTFSSTVNSGASYLVRDLWQPLVRPGARQRELIGASYVATILLVAVGIIIGFNADSIGAVFSWIMVALGAAFVVPNVLRWYWWRLNGWGYAIGTLAGLSVAILLPALPWLARQWTGMPKGGEDAAVQAAVPWLVSAANSLQPLYVSFPVISVISLVATLVATFATYPTRNAVLVPFFESVRPFGFWGPIRRKSRAAEPSDRREGLALAVVNVVLGCTAILGVYLGPMYLVGHWFIQGFLCLAIAAVAIIALYFTWYRNLPDSAENSEA